MGVAILSIAVEGTFVFLRKTGMPSFLHIDAHWLTVPFPHETLDALRSLFVGDFVAFGP